MGTQIPPKRGHSPPFLAHVHCGQTVGWIKMSLGTEVGLCPGAVVLDWDPPPPKGGTTPHFSTHVYCGQAARWIIMPLSREVELGPGDIVLDGDPAPPKKGGTERQIFGQCPLWPNGWLDQDATWYGSRPRHRRHYTQLILLFS